MKEVERRAALLGAGGEHGPDPLAPAAAGLAASSLGDLAVDHHEAEPLLDGVIGWLNTGSLQEAKVVLGVSTKPLRYVLRFTSAGRTPGHLEHGPLGPLRLTLPAFGRHLVTAVPEAEKVLDRRQQFLAETAYWRVRQGHEEFYVPDQMRPAELHGRLGVVEEFAVRAVVVAADNAWEAFAQELLQHVRTPRRVDVKQGTSLPPWRMEAPGPKTVAVFGMARFIDVDHGPARQGALDLFVARRQGRARLANDLGQLPGGDRQVEHVGEEGFYHSVAHVARALLVRDERREPWTHQPSTQHFVGKRFRRDLACRAVKIQPRAMLGHFAELFDQL